MNLDPKMMKQLMSNLKMEEVPATRVIIETEEGDLVINQPSVQRVKAQGKDMFQVSGEVSEEDTVMVSEEDLELVMSQCDCTEDEALEALGESEGDIAGAILFLKEKSS